MRSGRATPEAAGDEVPSPRRAHGGDEPDAGRERQRPAVDRPEPVQERAGPQPPDDDRHDRRTSPASARPPTPFGSPDGRLHRHAAAWVSTCAIRWLVRIPAGQGRPTLPRRGPEPLSEVGVGQPAAQRGRQRSAVTGRHQEAGPAAIARPAQSLRQPADRRRDDRQSARQSLGDHHAVRLGVRGEHQHVGRWRTRGRGRRRSAGRKTDPVGDAGLLRPRCRRPSTNAGSRSSVPTQTHRHGRSAVAASAASNTSWPLCAVTAATHSSSPPRSVPEARPAGSTPGCGHVNLVRRQRVAQQQPVPGPRTRGDDGGDGGQNGTLAGLARRRPGDRAAPHRGTCGRERPAAAGRPRGPGCRAPWRRSGRRSARRRRPRCRRSAGQRAAPPRHRATASDPGAACLDHLPTDDRRVRRRSGGRRCCRRSVSPGRRGSAGTDEVHGTHSARSYEAQATCDSCSVTAIPARSLAASPKAPACTRSARRSATTRASTSVVVVTPAKSGSSSRLR